MNMDLLTNEQLFEQFSNNCKVMATAVEEIMGDEPFPDPRTTFKAMEELTQEDWYQALNHPDIRARFNRNLSMIKIMTEVQVENADLLEEMLSRTA